MTAKFDLKRLQTQFQNYIRHLDDAIENSIVSSDKLNARTRLEIYRNAYYARFEEALRGDFPVLAYALGEELFYQLSCDYADRFPSQYRSISEFGQHLAQFMSDYALLAEQSAHLPQGMKHGFLIELSQMEWALARAFHADDESSMVVEADLAQLPAEAWPGLCFRFHASVQLLPHHYNVIAYWNAVKQFLDEEDDSESNIPQPQALAEQHCLVWRHGLITAFRSLDAREYLALRCVVDGESFSMLCDIISSKRSQAKVTIFLMVSMR